MRMRLPYRLAETAVAITLLGLLNGCGGSDVTKPPLPPPTPPPPPPPQVVSQGTGFPLEAEFIRRMPFTTSRAGALEATVDWTFATNDIDVALVRGDCSFDEFEAEQCPLLALSASVSAKPERIRTDGAAAGAYTLFVYNSGPEFEILSYQVVLTPSATGVGVGASAATERRAGYPFKKRPRGSVE